MTDAQMLQNLLAVYETLVEISPRSDSQKIALNWLKEVIAELRRRIELEEST